MNEEKGNKPVSPPQKNERKKEKKNKQKTNKEKKMKSNI